jgi:hypothetical protein
MEFYLKAVTIGILVVGIVEYIRRRFTPEVKVNITLPEVSLNVCMGEEVVVAETDEGLSPFEWASVERKRLKEVALTKAFDGESEDD